MREDSNFNIKYDLIDRLLLNRDKTCNVFFLDYG